MKWVVFDVLNVGWVSCFVEFYTDDTFPVGKRIYSEKKSLVKKATVSESEERVS